MHEGLSVTEIEQAVEDFFPEVIAPGIFPEMKVLTLALKESGCQMWAISSTNDWVVRVRSPPIRHRARTRHRRLRSH